MGSSFMWLLYHCSVLVSVDDPEKVRPELKKFERFKWQLSLSWNIGFKKQKFRNSNESPLSEKWAV